MLHEQEYSMPVKKRPEPHSDAYQKFRSSMIMDYEKWHDGEGYDLAAFEAMRDDEKEEIIAEFTSKGSLDWRDQEVLALVGTPDAKKKLKQSAKEGATPEERTQALRRLSDAGDIDEDKLDAQLAEQLAHVAIYNGITPALDMVEDHYGPKVKMALLAGARDRPEVAVHYAAMLFYKEGLAKEEFDWDHRPFFLRFGEESPPADRKAAFEELCDKIKVDPKSVKAAAKRKKK
jgi:hypothetical protein